jgi:hypothetical protein
VERSLARQIRDRVGDCGACRLFSRRLATQSEFTWLRSAHLSPAEYAFYARHLGEETMSRLGYAPQLIPLTVLAPVQ